MEKFGTQVLSKISMENSSLLNIQTKTINIKLKIVGLKKVDGDITTALSIKYKANTEKLLSKFQVMRKMVVENHSTEDDRTCKGNTNTKILSINKYYR